MNVSDLSKSLILSILDCLFKSLYIYDNEKRYENFKHKNDQTDNVYYNIIDQSISLIKSIIHKANKIKEPHDKKCNKKNGLFGFIPD